MMRVLEDGDMCGRSVEVAEGIRFGARVIRKT